MGSSIVRFDAPACTRSHRTPNDASDREAHLIVVGWEWREAISELPVVNIDCLLPDDRELNHDAILGQAAKLTVASAVEANLGNGVSPPREFHGLAVSIDEPSNWEAGCWRIRVQLQNWLWLLTQTSRCRVFQNLTVVEILTACLSDTPDVVARSFDVKRLLSPARFAKRRYCVQYNETDFAFLSRLLEEEGIYFYLDSDGKTIVFADDSTMAPAGPKGWADAVPLDRVAGGVRQEPRLSNWRQQRRLTPAKFVSRDFTFLSAEKSYAAKSEVTAVKTVAASVEQFPTGVAKWYDQTKDLDVSSDGNLDIRSQKQRFATIRSQAIAAGGVHIEATGNFVGIAAGYRLNATCADTPGIAGDYLVASLHMQGTIPPPHAGNVDRGTYSAEIRFLPLTMPFRPAQRTPKPTIAGTQSAIVLGVKGAGSVHTDELGRVRVRFPWAVADSAKEAISSDLDGGGATSCWLRVAQPWAGDGYGMVALPRVGHEVVVAFENGDPDAPIVLGSAFNSTHSPPFELPDNRFAFGVMSRSNDNSGQGAETTSNAALAENSSGPAASSANKDPSDDQRRSWVKNGYNSLLFSDREDNNFAHLHGRQHLILDSSGDLTAAVAGQRDLYVGQKETHLVGAGVGTALLGLSRLGVARSYRPGDGELGPWKFDHAWVWEKWKAEDPSAHDGLGRIQRIVPTPFASRLDMTVGRRHQYSSVETLKTNHHMTINAPVFGSLSSENALNYLPYLMPTSPLRELFRFLNWSSSIHYVQGRHFEMYDRPNTIMRRGGRLHSVGNWPGNLHSVASERFWILLELLSAIDHILPALRPANALATQETTGMAVSTLLRALSYYEFQAGKASQMAAGARLLKDAYVGNRPFVRSSTIAEIAVALTGLGLPGLDKTNSYEHVKGHAVVETGGMHAISAGGLFVLQSRDGAVSINACTRASMGTSRVEIMADSEQISLGYVAATVNSANIHFVIDETKATLGSYIASVQAFAMNCPQIQLDSSKIEMVSGLSCLTISDTEVAIGFGLNRIVFNKAGITLESKSLKIRCIDCTSRAAQFKYDPNV